MTILLDAAYEPHVRQSFPIYAFLPQHFPGLLELGDDCTVMFGIVMECYGADFQKTAFKGEAVPFVMEPSKTIVCQSKECICYGVAIKDFAESIYGYIHCDDQLLFLGKNFDTGLNMVSDSQHSILALAAGSTCSSNFYSGWIGDRENCDSVLISGFLPKKACSLNALRVV